MAAPAFRKGIHSAAILVCVLLAAAAVQSCAATSQTQSATRPHAKKRPHRPPTRKSRAKHVTVKPHPKPRRKPARKAVPRKAIAARKPAAMPAANKRIAATFPRVATVEQVLVRNCGTPSLNQTTRVAVHDRLQPRINQLEQGRAAPVTVRVFFAIIQNGTDAQLGYLSDQQIAAQMSVLNSAFSGVPVIFVLAGVQCISNHPEWWNIDASGPAASNFKASTRQGTFADLNYYVTSLRNNVLGITTLPFYGGVKADGVLIHPYVFPGGLWSNFGLGYTAVHEAGHWFSLQHPFDGGCSEPNDGCSDTAETAAAIFTCPTVTPNTCPRKPTDQPVGDPIHNFMSYTPDACMSSFTAEQLLRMSAAWDTYRAPYQLKPLPLPGTPILRMPPPAPPSPRKAPTAPIGLPRLAPTAAKPVSASSRTAPKKATKSPVKKVGR